MSRVKSDFNYNVCFGINIRNYQELFKIIVFTISCKLQLKCLIRSGGSQIFLRNSFYSQNNLYFFDIVFTSILIELTSSQDGIYFSKEAILSGAHIQANHDDSSENVNQNKLARTLVNKLAKG